MDQIRRRGLALGLLSSFAPTAWSLPGKADLKWLQIGNQKGVNGAATQSIVAGGQLAFKDVNARGGILGRRLVIETLDSGADPTTMGEAIAKAKQRDDLFGVFTVRGTAETVAVAKGLPGWPIFGPSTGADPVRKMTPANVFFTRTGWSAEIDRLMAVARNIGFVRIGAVYPDGPIGQAAHALLDAAVKKHGLSIGATATIPNPNSLEVGPAVAKLAASNVQMVIVALAGPAPDFILAARRAGMVVPLYTLSDAVGPEFLAKLKDRSRGIGMSSAIPSPWDSSMPIVRDYQHAMREDNRTPADYSFASIEGYINARLLIEVLKRAGPELTRERFIETARTLRLNDLGGLAVDFTKSNTGLSYTDVFVISSSGRVMR